MKVHLFGAASSPGYANYGLKHLAAEEGTQFSEPTVRFIQRNFLLLTSVDSETEAIQLVQEAREPMVHQFRQVPVPSCS